jgi:phosphatidylglycerophosphate synthase
MDGHFARKYSMTSKGGDLYDHIKDVSVYILLIYVVYIKYRKVIRMTDLVIIFIAVLVSCAHMGCQQKQLDKEEDDETLDYAKCLCPDKNMIYYTRWMGMGTLMLISIGMILYIHYRCNSYMGATGDLNCKA